MTVKSKLDEIVDAQVPEVRGALVQMAQIANLDINDEQRKAAYLSIMLKVPQAHRQALADALQMMQIINQTLGGNGNRRARRDAHRQLTSRMKHRPKLPTRQHPVASETTDDVMESGE